MTERIGSPENDPAPRDGTASRDQAKPGLQERAATFVVAGILGLTSHTAGDQPRHDLAEGGHDRPELAAKADRGTAIRPSAGDRVVVEASAPDDDPSPGQRLDEWEEKYVGEFLTSVAEDQEKRKDES